MPKTALLLGATGLVGIELLSQLLESEHYDKVVALVRRPIERKHPKLQVAIVDFDHPDPALLQGDDLFCALGTTLRKAGSKEAQYRIDCTYPAEFGRIAKHQGVKQYLLVSSLGADAGSSNFYLRTKGDLEQRIAALDFENFVSARPSFLLGKRSEFRLGEKIGIILSQLLRPLIPKRFRGVQASRVAAALVNRANCGWQGVHFLSNEDL